MARDKRQGDVCVCIVCCFERMKREYGSLGERRGGFFAHLYSQVPEHPVGPVRAPSSHPPPSFFLFFFLVQLSLFWPRSRSARQAGFPQVAGLPVWRPMLAGVGKIILHGWPRSGSMAAWHLIRRDPLRISKTPSHVIRRSKG